MKLEEEFYKRIEQQYPESQPEEGQTLEECQELDIRACKSMAKGLVKFLDDQINKEITRLNLEGRSVGQHSQKTVCFSKIVGLIEFKKKMEMI